MKTYKMCPACGSKNSEDEAMCVTCGVDISSVATVMEKNIEVSSGSQLDSGVKKCPKCSAGNPDYALLCDHCSSDLSNVLVTSNSSIPSGTYVEPAKPKSQQLILFSNDDAIEIVFKGGETLGRCDKCRDDSERQRSGCRTWTGSKNFIDCAKYNAVSRKHADFIYENGSFYIVAHIDAKNITLLNDEELERGRKYKINDGDRLQFSSKLRLDVAIR